MVWMAVTCPYCQSDHIVKRGKTDTGKQRYRCQNPNCPHQSFLLNPAYKRRLPEIKEQIIDIAALLDAEIDWTPPVLAVYRAGRLRLRRL